MSGASVLRQKATCANGGVGTRGVGGIDNGTKAAIQRESIRCRIGAEVLTVTTIKTLTLRRWRARRGINSAHPQGV
eukprot:15243251-Alexandrium_andersonii.AAC.1